MKRMRTIMLLAGILVAGLAFKSVAQEKRETKAELKTERRETKEKKHDKTHLRKDAKSLKPAVGKHKKHKPYKHTAQREGRLFLPAGSRQGSSAAISCS